MPEAITFTIDLNPKTKKNHQNIYVNPKTLKPFVSTSDAYKAYAKGALMLIPASARQHIDYPVNVKAIYYMQTRRKVDIANLHSCLHDVLVSAGVLADDNSGIVAATDGSRVRYCKEHPRTEVVITRMNDGE